MAGRSRKPRHSEEIRTDLRRPALRLAGEPPRDKAAVKPFDLLLPEDHQLNGALLTVCPGRSRLVEGRLRWSPCQALTSHTHGRSRALLSGRILRPPKAFWRELDRLKSLGRADFAGFR